jgi:hypothetical protein
MTSASLGSLVFHYVIPWDDLTLVKRLQKIGLNDVKCVMCLLSLPIPKQKHKPPLVLFVLLIAILCFGTAYVLE